MRLLICALLLCAACSEGSGGDRSEPLIAEVGRLENPKLNEASGLAHSHVRDDLYWAINDDGPAAIHALNTSGEKLGLVHIKGAKNRDWEDIASFELDGNAYLIVADIGDNDAKHKNLALYVVAEPAPDDDEVAIAWQINFRYPDGPRDAESLAVDSVEGRVFVLSKRTVPAELYQMPLQPEGDAVVVASPAGKIDRLPQPSSRDLRNPGGSGYGWQPTGMAFAPDGKSLLVLTYDGVNLFSREPNQNWAEAMHNQALHLGLGRYKDAEAITYTREGDAALVTVEKKHAPVLRVELPL